MSNKGSGEAASQPATQSVGLWMVAYEEGKNFIFSISHLVCFGASLRYVATVKAHLELIELLMSCALAERERGHGRKSERRGRK